MLRCSVCVGKSVVNVKLASRSVHAALWYVCGDEWMHYFACNILVYNVLLTH